MKSASGSDGGLPAAVARIIQKLCESEDIGARPPKHRDISKLAVDLVSRYGQRVPEVLLVFEFEESLQFFVCLNHSTLGLTPRGLGSGDTILISYIATPFGTRPRATIGDLVDRAPLTQTHRVRSRVPYEGKCVASIEVGPTACFNRSAQLNLAFCNQYRRWDLNPHPLARTGF